MDSPEPSPKRKAWVLSAALGGTPALLGLALIIYVVAEGGVMRSSATISTALVMGTLLVIAPAVLYLINETAYKQFEERLTRQARDLLGLFKDLDPEIGPPRSGEPNRRTGEPDRGRQVDEPPK